MKLLFVDFKYNYGDASRGLHLIGEFGFKKSFEKLGFEVSCFYIDGYLNKIDDLQKDFLAAIEKEKPDIVFFQLFEDQFETKTLDEARKMTKTINWFGDDTWRFEKFSSKYSKHLDISITTDKFAVAKYKKNGVSNVVLSQWAAMDLDQFADFDGKYSHDVTFVGQADPYRNWFVEQLKKKGIHVECFGFGWGGGHLSGDDMSKLFAQSKINLNLSNSVCYDIRFLTSSLKGTALAIRGKKSSSQIKARNFEICYGGGFQLTDWVPGLSDYYSVGLELDCFSTVDEAAKLIFHYLENESLREHICEAGQVRARSEHTYYHRLKRVFKEIDMLPGSGNG